VPEVRPPAPLAEALRALPDGAALVALHGEAAAPLAALPLLGAPALALVVGPEGGLTDEERAALRAAGALEGRLGPRTLRAETAAIAGLAVLQAIAGDLAAGGG
jgi:16S rRNA (uracil1498-N3)-methyltransferase